MGANQGERAKWIEQGATEQDLSLYDQVQELRGLLAGHLNEDEYRLTLDSLKNCTLTAFYTPPFVPDALYSALWETGIKPVKVYDPSAGAGIFLTRAIDQFPNLKYAVGVEKDLLTGAVLHCLSSSWKVNSKVNIQPFEQS